MLFSVQRYENMAMTAAFAAEGEEFKFEVVAQNFDFSSMSNKPFFVNLKSTDTMGKLMNQYSELVGVPKGLLRFMFKNKKINDEDTPKSLVMLMVEDDFFMGFQNIFFIIQVYRE